MDYQAILEEIAEETKSLVGKGHVADYIPQLAGVPMDRFGMAVQTVNGGTFTVGDAEQRFSIQSISKVYTLTLALKAVGEEVLFERLGREPSGTPFNSLVQLEYEDGIPRNPFINAGAIVVDDILVSAFDQPRQELLSFLRQLSGEDTIAYDPEVARSEADYGFRNRALANFIRSFGNLKNDVDRVLSLYFAHCSLAANCLELARSFLFLANHGLCPTAGERVLTRSQAKRISALMMTCGTYDAVGEFAYLVGLPAKSGVGGGIVATIPGELAVAVWSPALNRSGNSLAGTKALELFTTKTGISVF
ncbi:MAG: glutaminase [Desulfobacterales bacterium]|jgi:glutaminase